MLDLQGCEITPQPAPIHPRPTPPLPHPTCRAHRMASDLLVEGALDPEELAAASAAADTYIDAVFHGATPLPAGFEAMREEHAKQAPGKYGGHLALAWAFDPALEALAMHPRLWPIVLELTGGKPHLSGGGTRVGTMIVDDREVTVEGDPLDPDHRSRVRHGGAGWHSNGWGGGNSRFGLREDGTIFANNFVVFVYLDDVHPGDVPPPPPLSLPRQPVR
eukprot:COSAG04_NODE_4998_length_1785_cov_1.771649_1_plen_218_part_10